MNKKECLEAFRKYKAEDPLAVDSVDFMDKFGWYCKKHYFGEQCCEDPNSDRARPYEDGDFYDLMEIFQKNRDFIQFCMELSDGFAERDGEIIRNYYIEKDPNAPESEKDPYEGF